jgi:thiamine transporter
MQKITSEYKNPNSFGNPKVLAEIAIFISLATVLSLIIIYTMPQGGSITLASMVPILWLSLRRGAKIGIISGILYGIIQFILLPYAIDPIQVLLDYPLAFGVLGIAGFFQNRPIIGATIGVTSRFTLHFIAGLFFWAPVYAPELNPFIYSSVYNGSYILPESIISGFILYLLQRSNTLRAYL